MALDDKLFSYPLAPRVRQARDTLEECCYSCTALLPRLLQALERSLSSSRDDAARHAAAVAELRVAADRAEAAAALAPHAGSAAAAVRAAELESAASARPRPRWLRSGGGLRR